MTVKILQLMPTKKHAQRSLTFFSLRHEERNDLEVSFLCACEDCVHLGIIKTTKVAPYSGFTRPSREELNLMKK